MLGIKDKLKNNSHTALVLLSVIIFSSLWLNGPEVKYVALALLFFQKVKYFVALLKIKNSKVYASLSHKMAEEFTFIRQKRERKRK